VTIYEVARQAGVSISTVSRVLRGSDLVTPDTAARVRHVVADLRFTPNRLGRSLAEGRHAASGIVFPDLVGPYYAEVVLGYEDVAAALGRSVLILTTRGRPDAAEAVLELAGRVDGLAILGRTVDDSVVERVAASGVPLVLIAREPVRGVDTVRTRNAETALTLAEHLAAHGFQRIAFLGDPDGSPDVTGRYKGLTGGLRAAGRPAPEPVPCAIDLGAGEAAARRLLARRSRPDVVVCANDEVALGVHLAAEAAGLRIPDDLAVTGWDDVLAARFAGLTTVRQPMRELGAVAARWLHERMSGHTAGRTAETRSAGTRTARARRRVLSTQLVVRRSCGIHPPEVRT
jgi:LacI family transcriptional regulator